MNNSSDFRVSIGDDPDYEDLTAEIYYKETFFAMLTQDQGFENLQLFLFPNPNNDAWNFRVDEFLAIVEHAKQRLWDLRRVS